MEKHIKGIEKESGDIYRWIKGPKTYQYGDWLGLDAPAGSYRGASDPDLIQEAFYALDVSIMVKAYEALGLDSSEYKDRLVKIKENFNKNYPELKTQTEYALALHFNIAADKKAAAKQLADMIHNNGDKITTGIVGSAFPLHALSENGYCDLAYTLLLQEEYPSWLFSVNMGATTIWEHWDGMNDKGELWSSDMNSFNHYAYGAVADWVYSVAAGIKPAEAGFAKILVEPHPDQRLGFLEASVDTRHGKAVSKWVYKNGKPEYEITVPVDADIVINGISHSVSKGTYTF